MSTGNVILNRIVKIEAKLPSNNYYKVNATKIKLRNKYLGPTIGGVNNMMSNAHLSMSLMPSIIGVQPTDNNWYNHLKAYWNGLAIIIPQSGKTLNTTIIFKTDNDRSKFDDASMLIETEYAKAVESEPKNETIAYKNKVAALLDLEDSILDNCVVQLPEEYLAWRYAMVSNDVANRESDRDNSINIRFYISDELERKRIKDAAFKLSKSANRVMIGLLKEEDKLKFVISVLKGVLNIKLDTTGFDELDYQEKLSEWARLHPQTFLTVTKDTNLELKYTINRYVETGILKRMPNSTVIVDSATNDIVGNNTDEAIVFFKAIEQNKAILAKYKNQFVNIAK